ncbi:aminopeptidase [Trichlorobacter ammonificans]|uniref:Leucyl aminopeptidase (Aminopeptidase T) n=1 Tax=Trichlorobacter ammonificans TaxID=2916410 RepID=A0ABN8HFS2_9BACT|nr:aminopeptidase [Trichlorobacter ammonificans]CAH2030022.1 Leucyl aminopeptidase (Aminopeptidase T) [Trichlorobacter ammonificans]
MTKLDTAFSSLFTVNMGYRPGERILVFSDLIRDDEGIAEADRDRRSRLHATARELAAFAATAFGSGEFVDFSATGASGVEPPVVLWRALFGSGLVDRLEAAGLLAPLLAKSIGPDGLAAARELVADASNEVADIVIALSNNSTSHTNFRKLACHAGARFASLPHFDPEMFATSMAVDWHALAERTARLVTAVNRAEWVTVECPNGTAMHICKKGRHAEGDDGLLTVDGAFGNLPAGEAYLAPLEGESHGVMVIEWGPTAKLASPLTLTIAEGRVVRIDGDDPLRQRLEAKFAEHPNCRNLAELGIGTNDKASRPDNVLEAEKILGTIHLALGDNTGFGGTVAAPFHEDYVFYQPTVTLQMADGTEEVILDNGRLQV